MMPFMLMSSPPRLLHILTELHFLMHKGQGWLVCFKLGGKQLSTEQKPSFHSRRGVCVYT